MGSVAETATGEARLYERHADLVYRYCLRMLGTREDAEDATQTTFFQAVRALRRGVVPAFEQAWLLTIAKNECRSRHRASSRRRQLELVRDPQSLEELAEAPNGADGRLIGVQNALARLPEMQRRALLLREWQGHSYSEIANELGVTVPAVEALLFRARRSVACDLGQETKSRRHAFDLASLLGALKSALTGGAAVKLAAGLAAVATVATVSGGTEQTPAPLIRATNVTTKTTAAEVKAARAEARTDSAGANALAKTDGSARAKSKTRHAAPTRSTPDAQAATAQVSEVASPSPSVPVPAVPQAPRVPAVPDVPVPQPPQLPIGRLPQVPEVPQLPQIPQVPQVQIPQVPQVPQLPQVPSVPDVPDGPDLPVLP